MDDLTLEAPRDRRRRAEALPADAQLAHYIAHPDGIEEAAVRLDGGLLAVDPATAERAFGSDRGWFAATARLRLVA